MDVGTQTETSYIRDQHNKKKKKETEKVNNTRLTSVQQEKLPKPSEVNEKKIILCCEFEVFGIVQGLFPNSLSFKKR